MMTESLPNPTESAGTTKLPGASASAMFDETATTVTVLIRLALNASAETTTTGRR